MNTRRYKEKEEYDSLMQDFNSVYNYSGKAEREKVILAKRVKARKERKRKSKSK